MTPNCLACRFSYMEPDSPLICGHPESGMFGLSLAGPASPRLKDGHCGEDGSKFEQHPLRGPNGELS